MKHSHHITATFKAPKLQQLWTK